MVFTEGKKTESIYITYWNRLYRDRAIVTIAPHEHTTPFELAEAAAAQRRKDLKEASRGRGAAYDQYWCVFDVDEHPKIPDALILARDNNINVALSNPCFELWLLIHFDRQEAYIDRRDAQKRSQEYLKCDKVLTDEALNILFTKYSIAKSRAKALEQKHKGDGSEQPWNPYSDAWKLVEAIKQGDSEIAFLRADLSV
jgi:hypothetical protein